MSEELTPMDRMELWMSALNDAITNGTENTFMPYNRYELWMKKLCEAILAKDPADPDVVQAFVEGWLADHPEATTTVEDGAVTEAKLAANAVTTAKVADGAVTDAKLAASGVKSDVADLKRNLNSVATGEPENKYLVFQIGYLHTLPNYTPENPGQNTANNTICGTDYVSVENAKELFFDSANYNLCIVYYDANKAYQTYVGFVSSPNPYILDTQYAYFVPELRKKDNTAFTDPAVADGTVYYSYHPDMDIVRHAELSETVENIEQEIESINIKKLIQPEILPTLPYKVERTPNGYVCEEPDLTGFITISVDPVNGDDNNTGIDGSPVKTLARGLYRAQKQMYDNSKSVILNLADGSVFYVDDLPGSWGVTKSFVLRANNNATLIAGKKPTFTASGNHYVSEALTTYSIIGCVDMSETDDYGIFKTMNVVTSENEVESTDNSYYIDTENKIVYVNPSSSIDDIAVVFSNKYACNLAAAAIDESAVIMTENIRFVGNSTVTGRSASTVGETLVRTFYAKNCIFEHGFSNNAVSFNDCDYTYVVDCVAGYSRLDCFNYHFTRKPTPTNALVVEVNCKSKESGYYNSSDASDNLTTAHDGSNILRCGCHGYNGNGPLCADVNGCYSVCLDCNFINTSYTDKPSGVNKSAYLFDNAQASRDGKTILQNCFGYDSRNNRIVIAVDLTLNGINAGGAIEATYVKVGNEII